MKINLFYDSLKTNSHFYYIKVMKMESMIL